MISVDLPARINVVGSPTDAVEGAYATISAAVELRGGATIETSTNLEFHRAGGEGASFARTHITEPGSFALEAAALNALLRYVPELERRLRDRGAAIRTWTDIPASSGLGGSSVLILAVLAALRAFYELDARRYNDYVLAEIAQRAEEHDLGVVCGYADRYVPLFGDVAYLNYHGKLWHAPLREEPFVTYEKLGAYVPELHFCVATTGVRRHSGAVHAPMRERYLRERRAGAGPMLDLARQLGATAWRGKISLLAGDLEAFGEQINVNQQLIDHMMRTCGFPAGAGVEVSRLISAARRAGALGAKLTGAGGGGAVYALARPGQENSVRAALEEETRAAGWADAEVFVLRSTPRGLTVHT